jgi:peptidoglycan/LPS O-acetylase OafA/YrhL
MENVLTKSGKYPGLDGLRGFGIIGIVFGHSNPSLFGGFFLFVDVFFVLGGFLITLMLLNEYVYCGTISIRQFYLRRFLRLGPAYLVFLLAYALFYPILNFGPSIESMFGEVIIAGGYMTNWARAFDWYAPDYLGHTWTLGVEEQFYLLWPWCLLWLLRTVKTRKNRVLSILALALSCSLWRAFMAYDGASLARLYNGFDMRVDEILFGTVLAIAVQGITIGKDGKFGRWLHRIMYPVSFGSIIIFLWLVVKLDWTQLATYYWQLPVIALLSNILILDAVLVRSKVHRYFFETKPLIFMGKVSYALYLWHFPVIRYCRSLEWSPFSVLIVGGGISVILSFLSYVFIESFFLQIKDKLSYRSKVYVDTAVVSRG